MPLAADDGIVLGRREYERFAVAVDAVIRTEAGAWRAVTRDLSRGGVCFLIPEPMPTGSEFQIALSLVLGENTFSEPLLLSGVVVWCTSTEEGYQIGASFTSLNRQIREYLLMFLNFLAEGVSMGAEGGRGQESDTGPSVGGGPAGRERGLYG